MELKALNQDGNKGRFVLNGTNIPYINTIRRLIKQKVPTLAIEEVTITENGSALYDEIIAHRLGLIPLTTDLGTYVLPEKCKCKGNGCARCQLIITLEKKGPGMVYAEDLNSTDPNIKAAYPKTPIVKLLEGQNLKLEATAVMGYGKKHMKFAPGLMYYQGYPQFKIKEAKDAKKSADACPKKILELTGKKLKVTDETKCDLCMACTEACPEAISIEGSKENFILSIESWGQLSIKEMLTAAVESFDEELNELQEEIKKLK